METSRPDDADAEKPPKASTPTDTAASPPPPPPPPKKRFGELSALEKLACARRNITVEPLLACYVMPSVLAALAVQNLNLEKACRVNLAYPDDVCTALIEQTAGANYTREVVETQTLVANLGAWKYPLQTAIPALMIIFVGAWSDRTGRRKPCMLLPMVGEFLTSVGLVLCTYFFLQWPLGVAGVIEALPPALTGGWTTMFMAVFSYIADNTTLENRTFRTGVANVFVSLGIPVGTALSGVLTRLFGYYGIFSISITLYVCGFAYGCYAIKDRRRQPDQTQDKLEGDAGKNGVSGGFIGGCADFLNPAHVRETLLVAFKAREGSRRTRVMLLMVIFVTITGPMYGETVVVYLFTRYRFNFTEVDYSIFVTYSVIINLIGTLIAISLFSRYLKMDDCMIGAISGISKIAASFIYALAPSIEWFYLAPVVDMFSGTGLIVMRSIASKLVEPNETGKIHSLFGVCEAVVPILYSPMYSQVYVNSLDTLPGMFYLLGAMLMVPSVIVFIGMYLLAKKDMNKVVPETKKEITPL